MDILYFNSKKEKFKKLILQKDIKKDIYGALSVYNLFCESNVEEAEKQLKYTADWFERPHPTGRDIRGESDFVSIRLVPTLFFYYDKASEETQNSLKNFFLKRDYSSIYQSENHALMYRVSRYLAAQFFEDEYFNQFKLSCKESLSKDSEYLHEFINFRAKRGWGEFDSLAYASEIMLILNTLYFYAKDKELKEKARKMMDVILLDMITDSKNSLYGGAHGRIYEKASQDTIFSGMFLIYNYYFGSSYAEKIEPPQSIMLMSDYLPSKIVYEVEKNRSYPYENRERKHLHIMSGWGGEEINRKAIEDADGAICKYTYICNDYMMGAVNHQDSYPDLDSGDASYAHHQQHEWEFTLFGGTNHKIFSHHPGDPGYHHIHNRWTGDNNCSCGNFYANKNTTVAMYNIEKENEYKYINAYIPLNIFEEKKFLEKYLFLKYKNLYIFVYFDNGYRINDFDEYKNIEFLSDGSQNMVVCHVEYVKDFENLNDFSEKMRKKKMFFDKDERIAYFDEIILFEGGNIDHNNVVNVYPYKMTYDCPYMKSVFDSGIIQIKIENFEETYIFD